MKVSVHGGSGRVQGTIATSDNGFLYAGEHPSDVIWLQGMVEHYRQRAAFAREEARGFAERIRAPRSDDEHDVLQRELKALYPPEDEALLRYMMEHCTSNCRDGGPWLREVP